MTILTSIFRPSCSILEERVGRLNDVLDRRLVNMTMRKLKVSRSEAERIVHEKVEALTSHHIKALGV